MKKHLNMGVIKNKKMENTNTKNITRETWLAKSSQAQLNLVDQLLNKINGFTEGGNYELTYNTTYVGLRRNDKALNWSYFVPQRHKLIIFIIVAIAEELTAILETNFKGNYSPMKEDKGYKIIIPSEGGVSNIETLLPLLQQAEQERLRK